MGMQTLTGIDGEPLDFSKHPISRVGLRITKGSKRDVRDINYQGFRLYSAGVLIAEVNAPSEFDSEY